MLGSVDVAVLQACYELFFALHMEERSDLFEPISFEKSERFELHQVATKVDDFCVGCGEYLLFDGYFLSKGILLHFVPFFSLVFYVFIPW